jgi:hypothetical protein
VRPESSSLATYVVEPYVPGLAGADVTASVSALRAAVAVEGAPLRLVCSLFIRDDELCLHVLVAPSEERVAAVAGAAEITAERIVAATAWPDP